MRACPVANVCLAGLRRLGGSRELVERHIQEAGRREVIRLRRYLRVLSVIAAVTPLMGLLGTIFGMIRAFQTVATSGEALGKTELLAEGIYEAMITTAAGLLVAIPALIGYHWISARIEQLVAQMDQMTCEFVEDYARPSPATPSVEPSATEGDRHVESSLLPVEESSATVEEAAGEVNMAPA